jgi:hypothetical protein
MAISHNTLCEPATPVVREWSEVLYSAFPALGEITDAARETTRLHSQRFRGSMRMSTGRFYTTDEYNQKRKEVLAKRLP